MDKASALRRVERTHTVAGFTALFRLIIKEDLHIKEQLTFTELAQSLRRRKLPAHVKPAAKALCQSFEELSYGKDQVPKAEIEHIKKELRTLIDDIADAEAADVVGKVEELRQRKSKTLRIKEDLGKGRKKLASKAAGDIRDRILAERDKEFVLLERYVQLCQELGEKGREIRDHLKKWGFPEQKVSAVFSELGGAATR